MPRRRRPSQKVQSKPRPVDRKDDKLKKRWNTFDDIELDEEDQFHASRDKILLDQMDEADEDGDEEEVFALQGMASEDDEVEDPYEASDDEPASDGMHVESEEEDDDDDDDTTVFKKSTSKSKSKSKPSKAPSSEKSSSDSEEEETWGRSKGAYYSSNAAQLDSEDEEANELEEQEALRLQAKARESMCDQDFGLGDVIEGEIEPPQATERLDISSLPLKEVPRDKQTILRTLEREYPETLALARDWDDTVQTLLESKARVEALNDTKSDALEFGLQHMYYQALLTYATTLAFYLHLCSTEKYAARPELLRRHPILNRLLTLKEGIHTLENLGIGQDVPDDDEDEEEDDEEEEDLSMDQDGDLWSLIKKKGLELGELADLLEDAAQDQGARSGSASRSPSPSASSPPARNAASSPVKKSKKPKPTQKERAEAETRHEKKRMTSAAVRDSDHQGTRPAFDLQEPDYSVRDASRKRKREHEVSVPVVDTVVAADPYGEASALGHYDASDKQARRKSLRFYVSRIESASSRRTNARANAISGDDDIPYRERKREREIRQEKETEKKKDRGLLGAGGDDLDDVDPEVSREEKKRKRKRGSDDEDTDEDIGGADGYYDLVKRVTATKKARKKAEYEAATARPELESECTTGPRSITRAILKNKGLTPRRSKAVRNPRVKKRQKYDQAKKKVASQKAVYKGGIGDVSKYSGEQSGISKVVKSVRL